MSRFPSYTRIINLGLKKSHESVESVSHFIFDVSCRVRGSIVATTGTVRQQTSTTTEKEDNFD